MKTLQHWVPQVAEIRDLCVPRASDAQVCEYADLWHPINQRADEDAGVPNLPLRRCCLNIAV